MGKIGILWNEPGRWVLGKNCHLETISCHRCGSIETATVLHGRPEMLRFHQCGNCGRLIGADGWRLADLPGENLPDRAPVVFEKPFSEPTRAARQKQKVTARQVGTQGSFF